MDIFKKGKWNGQKWDRERSKTVRYSSGTENKKWNGNSKERER